MELSKQACLTLILVIAVYMDFKCYKINNKLIIIGMCIGSLHNFVFQGLYGLISSLLGGIAPIGLLFFLYISSVLGAGDIKLFAVVGSFAGISFCIQSIAIAFSIGAIISLVKMVRYGIIITLCDTLPNTSLDSFIQRNYHLIIMLKKKKKNG